VTVDAADETVFAAADSPVHGIVSLMENEFHVIAAHYIGRFHAGITATPFGGRH
jgi:hypothetical protein